MVNGILQEEEEVHIPWSLGFLAHFGKAFFPACISDMCIKYTFGWDAMKGFNGNRAVPASKKTT